MRREELAELIEKAEARVAKLKAVQEVEALRAEDGALDSAVRTFVLARYRPGDGVEAAGWKFTKVQGTTRRWNPDKLKKLVSPGVFKNLVTLTVVPAKIDEYVRAGKLKLEDVDPAFEITQKAPYVLVNYKGAETGGSAEEQADDLAAKLG